MNIRDLSNSLLFFEVPQGEIHPKKTREITIRVTRDQRTDEPEAELTVDDVELGVDNSIYVSLTLGDLASLCDMLNCAKLEFCRMLEENEEKI